MFMCEMLRIRLLMFHCTEVVHYFLSVRYLSIHLRAACALVDGRMLIVVADVDRHTVCVRTAVHVCMFVHDP